MSTHKHEHAGRLIILDLGAARRAVRVLSATPDGKDIRILASGISTLPDGVVVDTRRRARSTSPAWGIPRHERWAPQTLVCNGETDEDREDATRHCVGVSVDTTRGLLYWTQKALYAHLPEPIDLELDPTTQALYWTDRSDPPLGNTLNRADVCAPLEPWAGAKGPSKATIVAGKLHEAIGLSLDLPGRRAFVADLNGSVYAVDLDSGRKDVLIEDAGTVTGIVYCEA
ncbi:hypothetical protein FIBSPDRAFT_934217 [Athelia psychrophila]|uniref:YWTD domain-containing protein n=1 Tax=Athelia psychrophila TaxID=1759441 RepID=A0A166FSK1_9AGAM|nr:hypothetical protein FIBSPDRAFT_934217 [Fibularhizoctonia sp. CBS 109695]